jgi:hypothetical protein
MNNADQAIETFRKLTRIYSRIPVQAGMAQRYLESDINLKRL